MTLVQVASEGNTNGSAAPGTYSITATFASALTGGNTVIVAVGAMLSSFLPASVNSPVVSDTLGNGYIGGAWLNSGNQTGGSVGLFYASGITAGADTVTFEFTISGSYTTGVSYAVTAVEYSGLTSPIYQGSDADGVYGSAGDAPIVLRFVDGVGETTAVSFAGTSGSPGGPGVDTSVAVMDLLVAGVDYLFAACCSFFNQATLPTVSTGYSYSSFIQQELQNTPTGVPSLYFWDSAIRSTAPVPLPIIRGTSTALYPFDQEYIFYNTVSISQTANSYRSAFAAPTVKFRFPYDPVVLADRNTLKAFFESAKGQFSLNLSATTDREYDNLSFDSDEFSSTQKNAPPYSVAWSLSQVAGAASLLTLTTLAAAITSTSATTCQVVSTLGMPITVLPCSFGIVIDSEQIQVTNASGTTLTITRAVNGTTAATHLSGSVITMAQGNPFPLISHGSPGILPFTAAVRFQTITSSMPSAPKFTYSEFAGGLANFPTTPLGKWTYDEKLLSAVDCAIRIAHFMGQWGNLFPFSYRDEDGNVYTSVYYDSPSMSVRRNGVNDSAIKTGLIQMQS